MQFCETSYFKKKKVSETSFVKTASKDNPQQSLKSMLSGAIRKKSTNDKPVTDVKTSSSNVSSNTTVNSSGSAPKSSSPTQNGSAPAASASLQEKAKPSVSSASNPLSSLCAYSDSSESDQD